jgi:hypothetical protein
MSSWRRFELEVLLLKRKDEQNRSENFRKCHFLPLEREHANWPRCRLNTFTMIFRVWYLQTTPLRLKRIEHNLRTIEIIPNRLNSKSIKFSIRPFSTATTPPKLNPTAHLFPCPKPALKSLFFQKLYCRKLEDIPHHTYLIDLYSLPMDSTNLWSRRSKCAFLAPFVASCHARIAN